MGFPVGYTEIFLPKLFVQTLSVLSFIRTIVEYLLRHLHLSDYLESDPNQPVYSSSTHPARIPDSALLIREILPVIKFKELNLNLNHIGAEPPESCAVCLYEFEEEQEIRWLSNCKHIFHRKCLDRWIDHDQKTCPLCRTSFVPDCNQRLWIASDVSDFTVPVPEL